MTTFENVLNVIIIICSVIGTVIGYLTFYKTIYKIIGLFPAKKFPTAKENHNYAICVAARNEEKVIGNLLDSVYNQDYPKDKISVLVVADNCTDSTAEIVREFAKNHQDMCVKVYEHKNPDERTKGFALKYLFEQIKDDEGLTGDKGVEAFEGYFIFDADNVLNPNYITKMNEAFDVGNKIITFFRHSKNMNQNWISFSYAMHWMRTCLTENRAKGLLNQACRIQGTGFLFANELVKNGWNYTTLTEDRSFCTDAVIQNYRITYCDDAIFYDEQPYKLKVALRQRLRWSKGHLQSTVENCPKLLQNLVDPKITFWTTYDCFWLNFPFSIEGAIRRIIKCTCMFIIGIIVGSAGNVWLGFLTGWLSGLGMTLLSDLVIQICVLIIYRKRIGKLPFFKTVFHMILFPLFDIIGKWTSYVALFKHVEWKPIPHDTVMDVKQLK